MPKTQQPAKHAGTTSPLSVVLHRQQCNVRHSPASYAKPQHSYGKSVRDPQQAPRKKYSQQELELVLLSASLIQADTLCTAVSGDIQAAHAHTAPLKPIKPCAVAGVRMPTHGTLLPGQSPALGLGAGRCRGLRHSAGRPLGPRVPGRALLRLRGPLHGTHLLSAHARRLSQELLQRQGSQLATRGLAAAALLAKLQTSLSMAAGPASQGNTKAMRLTYRA